MSTKRKPNLKLVEDTGSQLEAEEFIPELPPQQSEMPFAMVEGEPLTEMPRDLYIPPDALQVFLEAFEGPLDLLLYLIRKQNLDILDIPIAEITRQYMKYIEVMADLQLELAGEYLLMAAMLAEIKSRMLLPRPPSADGADEDDPRAELVRRLQEYERFKKAAEDIDALSRQERDTMTASAEMQEHTVVKMVPDVTLQEMLMAFRDVLSRAEKFAHHHISRERLSQRERMSDILSRLQTVAFFEFTQLFKPEEGRMGVTVTFIAILELMKEGLIEIVQAEAYAPIHVRTAQRQLKVVPGGAASADADAENVAALAQPELAGENDLPDEEEGVEAAAVAETVDSAPVSEITPTDDVVVSVAAVDSADHSSDVQIAATSLVADGATDSPLADDFVPANDVVDVVASDAVIEQDIAVVGALHSADQSDHAASGDVTATAPFQEPSTDIVVAEIADESVDPEAAIEDDSLSTGDIIVVATVDESVEQDARIDDESLSTGDIIVVATADQSVEQDAGIEDEPLSSDDIVAADESVVPDAEAEDPSPSTDDGVDLAADESLQAIITESVIEEHALLAEALSEEPPAELEGLPSDDVVLTEATSESAAMDSVIAETIAESVVEEHVVEEHVVPEHVVEENVVPEHVVPEHVVEENVIADLATDAIDAQADASEDDLTEADLTEDDVTEHEVDSVDPDHDTADTTQITGPVAVADVAVEDEPTPAGNQSPDDTDHPGAGLSPDDDSVTDSSGEADNSDAEKSR